MKQYSKKEIIDIVVNAFNEATEMEMNGETAENPEFYANENGEIGVTFEIDLGRAGYEPYAHAAFKNGEIFVNVGEYLESGGVPSEFEENLQFLADELKEGVEITSEFRRIEVSHDSDAMDMLDAVKGILNDFDIEYTSNEDDGSPTIVISYEQPIK